MTSSSRRDATRSPWVARALRHEAMVQPRGTIMASRKYTGVTRNAEVDPHDFDPREGDTWCRHCNSAVGEAPHADLVTCSGTCGDPVSDVTAFTFEDRDGLYCEACYIDARDAS
jgi:hypothetical protein